MNDLISRAYVLAEYDRQHKGSPGGARKIIEGAPAIPAIPVEWMREKMRGYASSLKSTETAALVMVMQMWQKEQEAR